MSEANGEVLPNGWAKGTIDQLLMPLHDGRTLHHGWSPQCHSEPSTSEDVWGVLKTTAVQPAAFQPEHNKRLPSDLPPRAQLEVTSGDMLITCAGPRSRCGIACLVKSPRKRLILSGKMYRFRVSETLMEARYIEGYLQTRAAQIQIDGMKTGISDSGLNLTRDRFRKLSVPIAPLNEQRRIMDALDELLSDLDAGVAALERARTKLEHYRAAVLKAVVSGSLTAEWRKQHPDAEPASELVKRILIERRKRWEQEQLRKYADASGQPPANWKAKYKEPVSPNTSGLPELPFGWCWATMDQAITYLRNGYFQSPTAASEGIRILRIHAVRPMKVDLHVARFLGRPDGELSGYFIQNGDLLFTRYNGSLELLGVAGMVRGCTEPILHPDKLIRVRVADFAPLPHYLELACNVGYSRRHIESRARTTAGQTGISGTDIRPMPIPLPPIDEQQVIVEAVEDQLSVIDHLEADLDANLKAAQGLRQSILRHAFSGKLVPQDPSDESASELLKRIAAERAERERQRATERRTGTPKKTKAKARGS